MKQFAKMMVFGCFAVGLSACDQDVTIVDGRIPAQYLAQAQAEVGTFVGTFDGYANSLTFSLAGDKAVLTVGHSLPDPDCAAVVGNLRSVQVSDRSGPGVESAVFDFSAGRCLSVTGKQLELIFNKDHTTVQARIVDHVVNEPRCEMEGVPPVTQCWSEAVPVYRSGTFTRH